MPRAAHQGQGAAGRMIVQLTASRGTSPGGLASKPRVGVSATPS
eukprot:CAMPEP_0115855268 /NCGR_PEP_ID=MMETSP0287-20121206/14455_1 /TAXON_ID=412157 /ORGANISM="Chrysochromulina rotalis, Strain UIO044" /LENGTH=43 /DNA_ID= /DNA_START= /DNA_END= /DNA_ORIENTATION=